MNPNTLSSQLLPLSWAGGMVGAAVAAQIPHLSTATPGSKALLERWLGGLPQPVPAQPCPLCVPTRGTPAPLGEMMVWWVQQAQLQCTAVPTWQTSTSAFLSQLQREIQRPYHTSSKIKIIITKHSLEEDSKGNYVIKSFFLLECIKRLWSLLWIPDKLCIIFLFELAWFIYLFIINT